MTGCRNTLTRRSGALALALLLLGAWSTLAVPLRLTVRPKGTNQVEITLAAVATNQFYEILARTNAPNGHWIQFAGLLSDTNTSITSVFSLAHVPGLTAASLRNWRFAAGRWDDPLGDGLPFLFKELVLRVDPYSSADPYADPMGDGWSNLQKLQNNMDPFKCYAPPPPLLSVSFRAGGTNTRYGSAFLTWDMRGGPVPDYFVVERAVQKPRFRTNTAFMRPVPYRTPSGNSQTNGSPARRTSPPPYRQTNASPQGTISGPPGRSTNRFAPQNNRPAGWQTNRFLNRPVNPPPRFASMSRPQVMTDGFETGPFVQIARVPGRAGLTQYHYVDPNVDTLFQAKYRLAPHNVPPSHAYLDRVDTTGVYHTIIPASMQPTTNGFALTVPRPIPYAWYLLLVRDQNDPQWRASGYFASPTNRDPIHLLVDKRGMMSGAQSPIAMPEVRFLPEVVQPEFAAGWGEDSDGDGLPDIYEVLVTRTAPDDPDTGNTGILDGFREASGDGWSNLEKFRRRADPLRAATPPPPAELRQPTGRELIQALTPKTDLNCEIQIAVRTNGLRGFQPIDQVPWMLSKVLNFRNLNERRNFDVRVSWQFAERQPTQASFGRYSGDGGLYEAVAPLMARINLKTMTAFKEQIESSPPVSWNEARKLMALTEQTYHEGDIDKGLAMARMMVVAENVSQEYYGKVVDQQGQPVADATVTANTTRDSGLGGTVRTQTDSQGFFQFAGLRGRSLNIAIEKRGFEIQGHGLGTKNMNGPETSLTNRAVFTMWKLKGAEPMIHDSRTYHFKPDNRIYVLDLLSRKMSEDTNETGDLLVQFQRPLEIKRGERFGWSFTLTATHGGLCEAVEGEYLNEAPSAGYRPVFAINMLPTDPKWSSYREQTLFVKSRNGQAYGHIHLKISPQWRDGAALELDSYVNPSGSRNLEFDPAKQTNYVLTAQSKANPTNQAHSASHFASTNRHGQVVSWGALVLPLVAPGTRFTAVAAGSEHSLALKSDSTVVAWGRNLSGEATVPAGLSNVIALAAGGRSGTGFSVALKKDGHVVAWGNNALLQTSVPAGLSNVVAIAAGTEHCLALKKDGTVVGWGGNTYGCTVAPAGLSNVIAIAAGYGHSLALKKDGTVVAWGWNQYTQTNVPPALGNVVAIGAGFSSSLALQREGNVISWGGALNRETNVPVVLGNAITIAAGPWHNSAVRRDGTVVAWGRNTFSATQVPAGLSDVVAISIGGSDHGDHTLALRSDGTIAGWGNNNYGQSLSPASLTNITSVVAGPGHYLAIRDDGSVLGWGGADSQGDGQALVPDGLGPAVQVAAGWSHSLAALADGRVVGWGFHAYGQTSPPEGLTNVSALAAGYSHSIALKSDGTVTTWGHFPSSLVPPALSNVVAIAATSQQNLALKRDGTVFAWGPKGSIPTNAAELLTNVVAIAAGGDYNGDHDLALRRDGTVVAWTKESIQTNLPGGLTNLTAIAAGANHSLALRKDGTLIAWGANNAGQTTIPQGLTNVIAIAAGGATSVAIVAQIPESLPGLSPASYHWIIWLGICWVCVTTVILVFVARARAGKPSVTSRSD